MSDPFPMDRWMIINDHHEPNNILFKTKERAEKALCTSKFWGGGWHVVAVRVCERDEKTGDSISRIRVCVYCMETAPKHKDGCMTLDADMGFPTMEVEGE